MKTDASPFAAWLITKRLMSLEQFVKLLPLDMREPTRAYLYQQVYSVPSEAAKVSA